MSTGTPVSARWRRLARITSLVRASGAAMGLGVHVLEIEEDQVEVREQALEDLPAGVATGLHGRGETGLTGETQERLSKGGLGGGLAAGQGDAAIVGIEGAIAENFCDDVTGGAAGAEPAQRAAGTELSTGAEFVLFLLRDGAVGPALRTELFKLAAVNTLLRGKPEFRLEVLRLGVATPGAAERATFEEDVGAYAGAVVNGEALDVEDHALDVFGALRGNGGREGFCDEWRGGAGFGESFAGHERAAEDVAVIAELGGDDADGAADGAVAVLRHGSAGRLRSRSPALKTLPPMTKRSTSRIMASDATATPRARPASS